MTERIGTLTRYPDFRIRQRLQATKEKVASQTKRLKEIATTVFRGNLLEPKADIFVQAALPLTLPHSQSTLEIPRWKGRTEIVGGIFERDRSQASHVTKPIMRFGYILAGSPPESFTPVGLPEQRTYNGAKQLPLPYIKPDLLPRLM